MRPLAAAALHVLERPVIGLAHVLQNTPFFKDVLFYVDTREPVVALTLDDGPDETLTPLVLDVLADHKAQATFFLIGSEAVRRSSIVRRIADEGNEVANHTWMNESSFNLSASAFDLSLLQTHRVLEEYEPRLFRPGGGFWRPSMIASAARLGYVKCVLGSIYPQDLRVSSGSWIVKAVLKWIQPGAIIILHEGANRDRVVSILDRVLLGLRDRRYRVTTVSDLLGSR